MDISKLLLIILCCCFTLIESSHRSRRKHHRKKEKYDYHYQPFFRGPENEAVEDTDDENSTIAIIEPEPTRATTEVVEDRTTERPKVNDTDVDEGFGIFKYQQETDKKKWPHLVMVVDLTDDIESRNIRYHSGVLISKTWVLTADKHVDYGNYETKYTSYIIDKMNDTLVFVLLGVTNAEPLYDFFEKKKDEYKTEKPKDSGARCTTEVDGKCFIDKMYQVLGPKYKDVQIMRADIHLHPKVEQLDVYRSLILLKLDKPIEYTDYINIKPLDLNVLKKPRIINSVIPGWNTENPSKLVEITQNRPIDCYKDNTSYGRYYFCQMSVDFLSALPENFVGGPFMCGKNRDVVCAIYITPRDDVKENANSFIRLNNYKRWIRLALQNDQTGERSDNSSDTRGVEEGADDQLRQTNRVVDKHYQNFGYKAAVSSGNRLINLFKIINPLYIFLLINDYYNYYNY